MRVAHVIGSYREGFGYEENHLPHFQTLAGADVSLVTSVLPPGERRQTAGRRPPRRERIPGPHMRTGASSSTGWRRACGRERAPRSRCAGLKDTLRRIRPDILHVHGPIGTLFVQAMVTARSLDLPTVVDNHLCYFNLRPYHRAKRTYYRSLFRRAVLPRFESAIGRYIPLMPDSAAVLHNELGVPYDRMTHSSLGADTHTFRYDAEARAETRARLAIPSDAPVIALFRTHSPGQGRGRAGVRVGPYRRQARRPPAGHRPNHGRAGRQPAVPRGRPAPRNGDGDRTRAECRPARLSVRRGHRRLARRSRASRR